MQPCGHPGTQGSGVKRQGYPGPRGDRRLLQLEHAALRVAQHRGCLKQKGRIGDGFIFFSHGGPSGDFLMGQGGDLGFFPMDPFRSVNLKTLLQRRKETICGGDSVWAWSRTSVTLMNLFRPCSVERSGNGKTRAWRRSRKFLFKTVTIKLILLSWRVLIKNNGHRMASRRL